MAVLVLLVYCYIVLVIEKKRNLAPKDNENTPLMTSKSQKQFMARGHCLLPRPLPLWGGDTPSLHPPVWRLRRLDSDRAFGARPCPQLQLLDPPMAVIVVFFLYYRIQLQGAQRSASADWQQKSVYTIQQTSSIIARVFWIHLLEVCWTFAGSCKHPIRRRAWEKTKLLRRTTGRVLQQCRDCARLNLYR